MSEEPPPLNDPSVPEVLGPEVPRWSLGPVVWGVLSSLTLSVLFVVIYDSLTGVKAGDSPTAGTLFASFVGVWLGFGSAVFFASSANRFGDFRKALGLRFVFPLDIGLGILGAGAAQLCALLGYMIVSLFSSNAADSFSKPAESVANLGSGWVVVPLFVGVCVAAPFFEELFFRGLTLRTFTQRWGQTAAIIATSVLFGAIHAEALQTISLIGVGFVLSILAARTGRLGPSIIAHGLFNAFSFLYLVTN